MTCSLWKIEALPFAVGWRRVNVGLRVRVQVRASPCVCVCVFVCVRGYFSS